MSTNDKTHQETSNCDDAVKFANISNNNNNNNNTNKKKRKLDDTVDKDKDKDKDKDTSSTPSKRRKKSKKKDKDTLAIESEELECVVCRELPRGKIYQCANSHILCQRCHNGIRDSKKCECPICRVKLSRSQPSRNRFAEKYLSVMLMECTNNGCKSKIQFSQLRQHVEEECIFRSVTCKFAPLGCDWKGLSKDSKLHCKECSIRTKPIKTLLKNVINKNEEAKIKQEEELNKMQKYIDISKCIESRCRNIVIRDVKIDLGRGTHHTSGTFVAMGYSWQLEFKILNANDKIDLDIRLKASRRVRRRLLLEVVITKGIDLNYSLEPIKFEAEFSKTKLESMWKQFIVPKEQAQSIDTNREALNLRVMFIDKRPGDSSRRFTGDEDYDSTDDSDETSSYESDYSTRSVHYSDEDQTYDEEEDDDDDADNEELDDEESLDYDVEDDADYSNY